MTDDKKDYRIVLFVALSLILVIVFVYMKVQKFDFVGFDDELYVTQNYHVQKGISLEGIKWAFTTFHSANWHPLTWLSHMLDCELYGLNPAGHHWTSVEFHIANTLLLFFILFKMTGALWQSAFVAALFGLHPLHVESVAWISERKDVLSTFFGLSSIAAYYRYVKTSSSKYYVSAIVLFSLSLMAKPMLVTLPFVLLLLDFWPLKRFQWQRDFLLKSDKETGDVVKKNYRIILEKIPFFVIVVGSCIITFFAQKSKGAVMPIAALPLKYRIENAVVSYVKYVFKAIWPHKLAVFYPHPWNTLHWWQIVGAGVLLVIACYGALRTAKKYPYLLVGLLWYLGTLVPVIGLVQVGDQAMADRYSYVPLIGIFMIVAWGIPDLFKRLRDQTSEIGGREVEAGGPIFALRATPGKQRSEILSNVPRPFSKRRFQEIFLGISAGIILFALSWVSFLQLNTWKNGITLFEHAVSVTENNYSAYNNLGTAFEKIDLDKAMFYYKTALKIRPNDATALYNLGNVFSEKGYIDKAIQYYLKALNIKPNYTAALNNLGEALAKKGDYDKANYYFKRALKTDPTGSGTCMNFANALFLQAKPDIAVALYKKILQTDSENPDVHYNLAYVLFSEKKYNEAIRHYNETLRIDPKYLKAHYHLGDIYFSRGNTKKAFMHFATIIKLKPDYVPAYNKLGLILFKQGKFKKAGVFFSKALQLDPEFSKARTNLDKVRNAMLSRAKTIGCEK
jgi:tetratricopeptide (TPR) repeat protein